MSACSICSHPHYLAIEGALQRGVSLREIAAEHGVARSSLHRHVAAGHAVERGFVVEPPPPPRAVGVRSTRRRALPTATPATVRDDREVRATVAPPAAMPDLPPLPPDAGPVEILRRQLVQVQHQAEAAYARGDVRSGLAATKESRELLADLSKLAPPVSSANLASSLDFAQVMVAVVEALRPWPDAQLAVADALDRLGHTAEPSS